LLLVAPEAVFVQEEYRLFFGDDDFCEWLLHEIRGPEIFPPSPAPPTRGGVFTEESG
jgi:hypothetical protein